jgi:hypothetical protein
MSTCTSISLTLSVLTESSTPVVFLDIKQYVEDCRVSPRQQGYEILFFAAWGQNAEESLVVIVFCLDTRESLVMVRHHVLLMLMLS